MNWVESLNFALDYIENNLLEDISSSDVAGVVFISSFHFQRIFNLLTGLSVGEYVRKRRLSLVGQELTKAGSKVIDVAMKYGYETPESFSKAFSRFHGISPAQAKREGANLKSFNCLTIKIIMEGGSVMDYRIVKQDSFKVVVKSKFFVEETSEKGIPAFWSEYFAQGYEDKVTGAMGICGEVQENGREFKYGIGCKEEYAKEIPEGFEVWTIPAHTWAVFKCVGAMPKAIQNMWKRIYSEWLPKARHELIQDYEFENYTDGDSNSENYISEIWVPFKEKI